MKNFLLAVFTLFLFGLIPLNASAQPVPPPGYRVVRHCYTVVVPYLHTVCEYRFVRHYLYTPAPLPPPPRYTPGPRPGHHPPPPPHHGPGPRR